MAQNRIQQNKMEKIRVLVRVFNLSGKKLVQLRIHNYAIKSDLNITNTFSFFFINLIKAECQLSPPLKRIDFTL